MENSFPIIEKLNIINTRKSGKNISIYDFDTLYTTIPLNLLIKVLSEVIYFVFKSKVCSKIGFSTTSIHWNFKGLGKGFFTERHLIEAITYLINVCYFAIGNMVFKQGIGILVGIDPAHFWANLFLYFFESKYAQNLISKKIK